MIYFKRNYYNVCLSVSTAVCTSIYAKDVQRPNIILILTDDQGFDDYGFRQPPLETPVMDMLARESVRFDRFYTFPACAPTRAALMTGRNYLKTGTSSVGFGAEAPHFDEYFMGQALQKAGYRTGMVGKWNLGYSDAYLPHRRGFDDAWVLAKKDVRSYGRYEHYNPSFFHNGEFSGEEKGWQAERVTDKAIAFIEENKKNPFFLYLPYSQPHEPWLCSEEYQQKYIQKGIGSEYAMFLGMMEHLDGQIGRVLNAINDYGIASNTIVLFFGDNGPTPVTRLLTQNNHGYFVQTGESYQMTPEEWTRRNPSGLRDKKATAWENGVRNRLHVFCPGRFSPRVISEMALVTDIYPTILDLTGAARPENTLPFDGKSLLPVITGTPDTQEERVFFCTEGGAPQSHLDSDGYEYRFTSYMLPLEKRSSACYAGHWVIVNHLEQWSLHNLLTDPYQQKNLKESMPEKFAAMQKLYDDEKRNIWNDPHAFSIPIQSIGDPEYPESFIDIEYLFRMKGKNRVTWENTFFGEIGAIQDILVNVFQRGTYRFLLRATLVPPETEIQISVADAVTSTVLKDGKKSYYDLGTLCLEPGEQIISLKLVASSNTEAVKKMELWSLHASRNAE